MFFLFKLPLQLIANKYTLMKNKLAAMQNKILDQVSELKTKKFPPFCKMQVATQGDWAQNPQCIVIFLQLLQEPADLF